MKLKPIELDDFFGYKNSSASALITKMAIMIDMPILILDDNDLDTSIGDLKFGVYNKGCLHHSKSCMSTHISLTST